MKQTGTFFNQTKKVSSTPYKYESGYEVYSNGKPATPVDIAEFAIAKWGCYFLSILCCTKGRNLSVETIKEYYNVFVRKGWMGNNCYIKDATKIVAYLVGKQVKKYVKKTRIDGKVEYPSDASFVITELRRNDYSHFVVTDGYVKDKSTEHILWDPWTNNENNEYSLAATQGWVQSHRVFYIDGYEKTEETNSLVDGAIAYVASDAAAEISGLEEKLDNSDDNERLGYIKNADYNEANILAENIGYTLSKTFKNALAIQSKKPLYAIENPGYWFTQNTSATLEVTHIGDSNSFEELNGIQCYSKSLEELININVHLQYIFFITNFTSENNSKEFVGEEISYVAYIFKGKENHYILKNTIYDDTVLPKYYRTFTICNEPVVRWEDVNGEPHQYIYNVEDSIDVKVEDVYATTFKIGEMKAKKALMIDVRKRNQLTPKELQTKIIALQTLKPGIEQLLKKDTSPSWVAQRLPYNQYGVVTEDITLERNGLSYYWDIGKCWKIRNNEIARTDKTRNADWYWEVTPYLPGGTEADSLMGPAEKGYGKFTGTTDVIAADGGSEARTINVLPSVVAQKAYAMIIDDPEFHNPNLKTNGRDGVYFMSTEACNKKHATTPFHQSSDVTKALYAIPGIGGMKAGTDLATKATGVDPIIKMNIEDSVNGNIAKGQLIHPYDIEASRHIAESKPLCFINDEANTPTNGLLVEAKEKIFDVYFLTKETFTGKEVNMQYDILESLKTGKRENYTDKETGKLVEGTDYIATKYKKWIQNGLPEEEAAYKALLSKAKELQKKDEQEGYIEEIKLTEDLIENTKKKVFAGTPYEYEMQLYLGYKPGDKCKRYKLDLVDKEVTYEDGTKQTVKYSQYAGNIVTEIDPNAKFTCPVDLLPCNYEFTVHEPSSSLHNSQGDTVLTNYILSFGYDQERIAKLKPFEYFRETFKDFYKEAVPEDLKNKVPCWNIVGGVYVTLNQKFVDTFFVQDVKKGTGLKPNYKLRPKLVYKSDVNGFSAEINLSESDVKDLNKRVEEAIKEKEYKISFIDSKVEYVYDQFYNVLCNVWGSVDPDGNRRTKGYCVRGTPFELKDVEVSSDVNSENSVERQGFDARELLDYIILKTLTEVGERNVTTYVFKRLREFFSNNKIETIDNEMFGRLTTLIDDGIFTASIETGNDRYEFDLSEEQKKLRTIKLNNEANLKTLEIISSIGIWGTGVIAAAAATAVLIINAEVVASAVVAAATAVISHTATGMLLSSLGFSLGAAGTSLSVPVVGWVIAIVIVVVVTIILLVTFIIDSVKRSRNKKTLASNDYVYKFTCRAKRALKQYSMTTRGPLSGIEKQSTEEKNEEGDDYTYGDVEQTTAYYNWLAPAGHKIPSEEGKKNSVKKVYTEEAKQEIVDLKDGYDGRVMVIIPSTEDAISDDEAYNMFNSSALQMIEEFIQTWMGKKDSSAVSQAEIPIQSYYDFYSGMHPWVEIGLRMGLGVCGRQKTEEGVVYLDENKDPLVYICGNEKYRAIKEVAENDDGGKGTVNYKKGETLSKEEFEKICSSNFRTLNSIDYPYFQKMTISDNGVKKLNLTLYDPNFASYTTGIPKYNTDKIDENGSYVTKDEITMGEEIGGNVMSLEALLRSALRSPTFIQDDTIETYKRADGEIKSDYLSIDESLYVSPTNLKIRYGYDDMQPQIDEEYFNINGQNLISNGSRWYDAARWGTVGDNYVIAQAKKRIKDKEITNASGSWAPVDPVWRTSPREGLAYDTNTEGLTAEEKEELIKKQEQDAKNSFEEMVKSWAQTCEKSRVVNFMITKFQSTLKESGIQYDIEAIESKDANVMRTRFLQRYAEITANPEEVLYHLMHIFNEDNDGNNVKASRVKIILISDDEDYDVPVMRDRLNMEFDYNLISEEDLDGTESQNIYEKAYNDSDLAINEKLLKKITLTLGGASAARNYAKSNERPLYKTMAQLMNEFCSLCPPKKLIRQRKHYDLEGNDILSNQESTTARPLKWFSVEDEINDTTYVCLYYRTVLKVPRIRVYTWGPNNPTTSCVKSLSIKNDNEFGVLSGIRAFDGMKGQVISRTNSVIGTDFMEETTNGNIAVENAKPWERGTGVFGNANYVGVDARAYDNAFASCMYTGEMTILGDPYWTFDGLLQPCTMPIKLNVLIPQSEFTRYADAKGEYQDELEILRNTFNQREYSGDYWYDEGWNLTERMENGKPAGSPYDKDDKHYYVLNRPGSNVHQALHEMSGYYVVKTIVHEITPTSYTTRLGLMSYPNIQKDVILTKTQYNALKNKS